MARSASPSPPRNPARDDTHNREIVVWGTVSVVVLALMLVWLRAYFFTVRNETVFQSVLSVENPKLVELRAREEAELSGYGWIDRERGIVQLPIERAMRLVVEESAGGDGR
jgi:hypothetical protein